MTAKHTVSALLDEPSSESLALVAAAEDGELVGEFTLAGWVPRTGVILPGSEEPRTRMLFAYGLVGGSGLVLAGLLVAISWHSPESWGTALALAVLALLMQFFPLHVANANVSLGVGFLLAACLMCGPSAGTLLVMAVFALWSLGRELIPWFGHQRSPSAGLAVARSVYTTGSGALVYFVASWLAFTIFRLQPPVDRVTLESVSASIVLTVGVYVLHNGASLLLSLLNGENPASYLRMVIPLPALVEFLALPAALLLVVVRVQLGVAAFVLLAWLYLMAAFLGWRSWQDRTSLHRRLEDMELLHQVGASMSGTLEMGELILRFHAALREIVAFDHMLLVLRDQTEGVTQAFALNDTGTRGEVTRQRLENTETRPEGLVFTDEGEATYVREFSAGEAATLRLRLDFQARVLPSSHKMVLLETVCQQAGTALSNGHLYRLANTDTLTGLASRRYFERALRSAASRSDDYAVIMLDLDWFKRINDAYGHRVGDEVLRDLADILSGSLRVMDVAARYGGEEFVILLPASSSPEAAAVAERIRRALEHRVVDDAGRKIRYTASFGVAGAAGVERSGDPMTAVWRADAALLEAKRAGRNQVITFSALSS